ncbi:MAG: serine/threonine protein kinase [Myxococcales bacterium]|nr:serine/threonine protein kinase [Myxococcales bacterium]
MAELASGGMATVFLARLSSVAGFQRLYAIKRLHPHLQREQEFVDMFLDEARLAARIHHPNVVSILEVGESARGYYLVMEYVEGDTVAHLLARAAQKQTRLPTEVTLRIALDALAGLDAAHELKDDHDQPLQVVHRDVSPQNILIGVDGTTRITDFGVARAAARLTTTRTGQLKGKLAYMAPEQARGQGVDRRADVFALGIVLWEALAMRRLFKGDGEAETLSRVLNDVVPPLRSIVPTLPSGVEAAVMKALERDPANRFATAAEFADALEKAGRAVRCVGSHKDVAACLEAHMGAEISEQRTAVRTWLALSEPSRVARRQGAEEASGPQAVDRSEPRGVTPTAAQLEVTSPSGAAIREASGPVISAPTSVSASSLSTLTEASPSEPPPPARRKWAPILLAGLAGGALVAIVAKAGPFGAAPVATPAAAPPSATAAPVAPAPSIGAPVAAASSSSAPAAPAPAHAETTPLRKGTRVATPGKAAPAPSATAKSTKPIPDDISNNPYR